MSVRDNFWPMADRRQPGAARPGLRRLDLHRHHDGLRGDHPDVRRARWLLVLTGKVPVARLAEGV